MPEFLASRLGMKTFQKHALFSRLADNLPAATVFRNLKTGDLQYEDGFKVGFMHHQKAFINNHLTMIIKFHRVKR